MRNLISTLAIVLVQASICSAQAAGTITMIGIGEVAVVPDMASVSLGVEVEAKTAKRALQLNSDRMAAVFAVLQGTGVDPRDIQTTNLALHPQWNRRKSSLDEPLEVIGYLASNVVTVRIRDLEVLGQVLDALTSAGANTIHSISFGVAEPGPHIDVARERAVRNAIRKATLIAAAAELGLGPIVSIQESGSVPAPMMRMEASLAEDLVPLAEGEVVLRAQVTMTFGLK